MSNTDWLDEAACRHYDSELWFPPQDKGGRDPGKEVRAKIAKAKAICWGQCPVRVQCLAFANKTEEGYGVWGGYDSEERKHLRQYNLTTRTGRRFKPPHTQSNINADKQAAVNSLELAEMVGTAEAARQLGVSPTLLYRAWKKHGLSKKKEPHWRVVAN